MQVILPIDTIRFPLTGIGRYTYELARNLPASVHDLQLRLMKGCHFVDGIPAESTATSPEHSRSLKAQLRRWVQNNSVLAFTAKSAWVSFRESRALRGHEDAVFHGPQFHLPEFAGPSVVTIHDLSVYSWAHCHPPGRVRTMRRAIEHSVRQASVVLTDSEYTRQELIEFFSLSADKVRAVPLASSEYFYPRSDTDLNAVLQRHDLRPGGYCLFSGTIEPRKNLSTLLDAYSRLPSRIKESYPLVLCGYQGWRNAELLERINKAQEEGWVRYVGYVSSEDLPCIFAGARVFSFPSSYEGFGLPVLEAMASGVPVICSNSSSLPEVAGDAALMCAPEDTEALTSLLEKGLEDESWRSIAREQGLAQAAKFSWARCAKETGQAYRAAHSA